jgi:predicted permease
MSAWWSDLRSAGRRVVGMRGAALASILTLAVGVAATTSVGSLAYSVMFRPLPFPDSDALVSINVVRTTASGGPSHLRWPYAKIVALQGAAQSFEALAAYTSSSTVSVGGDRDPAEQVSAEIVSAAYFTVLRTAPQFGRAFEPRDDASAHRVAITTADCWRRWFPGEPFTPDRTLRVNGDTLLVIGVMPEGFRGLGGRADLWLPIAMAPVLTYREFQTTPQHFISLVGRLAPGVTLAQANAELAGLGPALPREAEPAAEPATWSAAARPLADARVDATEARSARLLLASVAGVLLVTCLNVTTLLVMHARLRQRVVAVRLALGARRRRIVRDWLTETGLIVAAAAIIALPLAYAGIAWLRWSWTATPGSTLHTGYVQLGAFSAPRFDAATFVVSLLLAIVCVLITGVMPALQASRATAAEALAQSSRSSSGSRRRAAVLRWLAGGEIAVAVLLLAGTLLLLATFNRLQQTRVGFDPAQVLTLWVTPPGLLYPPASGPAILARLLERVERAPGVTSAALNRCTPFGSSCARTTLFRPGQPATPATAPVIGRHYVSPRYFETLRIPLVAGRALTDADRAGRPPVTVINETAARRFWPGVDPIGQTVWFGSAAGFTDPARPVEVVGVVGDVKYWPIDEPPGPDFNTSYLQFAYPDSVFLVRAAGDPDHLVATLRRAIADVDANIPVWDVRPLDDVVAGALSRPRANASLTAVFAVTAAALAAFGIFAVMASAVASRRRELAIRIALGAGPGALRRLILGEASAIAIAGGAAGVLGAMWLLRLIRGFLYGVESGNPLVLGTAVAIMVGIALVAALVPAMRASHLSPTAVLKQD